MYHIWGTVISLYRFQDFTGTDVPQPASHFFSPQPASQGSWKTMELKGIKRLKIRWLLIWPNYNISPVNLACVLRAGRSEPCALCPLVLLCETRALPFVGFAKKVHPLARTPSRQDLLASLCRPLSGPFFPFPLCRRDHLFWNLSSSPPTTPCTFQSSALLAIATWKKKTSNKLHNGCQVLKQFKLPLRTTPYQGVEIGVSVPYYMKKNGSWSTVGKYPLESFWDVLKAGIYESSL